MDIETDFGIVKADAGALAVLLVKEVGDGVLDTVGDKAGIVEVLTIDRSIDGKRGLHGHQLLPVKALELLIQVIGAGGTQREHRLEDAHRSAAGKVSPVEHFLVALEIDYAVTFGNVLGAQGAQLVGEHPFQSEEGFRHHIKSVVHHVIDKISL